jgi:hypothetical protein
MACACNVEAKFFSWIFKRLQNTKAAKHWTDDNQKNNRTEVKYSPLFVKYLCIADRVQTIKNMQNHAHLFLIVLLDLPQLHKKTGVLRIFCYGERHTAFEKHC